ncbi:MAG TPA: DUF4185 domain-containing protein [Verrucomicrobiae bacterium]|nr:DUF4185 domain-containing protein [Verrucomicrobiae bacterium]
MNPEPGAGPGFGRCELLRGDRQTCRRGPKLIAVTVALLVLLVSSPWRLRAATGPYPQSKVITGIVFHEETLVRKAPGSDIWSCTWAANDQLYATWGDGGGFGGTDDKGRVSMGVATLTGGPDNWQGANVWGGWNPVSPQRTIEGKGTVTAVRNLLYLFVSEQGKWDRCRLWRSADYGLNWEDRGWLFPQSHKAFAFPAIVEFGCAQDLNHSGWIYGLSDNDTHRLNDGRLYLFRVRTRGIEKLANYEYFAGTPERPKWTRDFEQKAPVFQNASGISWGTTCVYHPGTGRFLLAVGIHEQSGDWGLYEGEHPWGPWRTVCYGNNFPAWTYAPAEKNRPAYLHTFPSKWMSRDGRTVWCVFDRGDHFNLARCTLKLSKDKN